MSNAQYGLPVEFTGTVNALAPRDYFVFFDDFLTVQATTSGDTVLEGGWNLSVVSGAVSIMDCTDASQEQTGGIVVLTPGATDSDQTHLRQQHDIFNLSAGYPLYFEARLCCTDTRYGSAAIGLFPTSEVATVAGITNGIGFLITAHATAASVTMKVISALTTTNTDTLSFVPVTAKWFRVALYYDGVDTVQCMVADDQASKGKFQVLDTLKTTTTTDYVPIDIGMSVGIEAETTETGANALWVDYVYCCQRRCVYDG
jgi:hypothetical protein